MFRSPSLPRSAQDRSYRNPQSAFMASALDSAFSSAVVSLKANRASPATLVNRGVNTKLMGGKIHHRVVSSDCTILTRSAPSFFASFVKSRTAPSSEASPMNGTTTPKCRATFVMLMCTASEPSTSFKPLKSGALLVNAQPETHRTTALRRVSVQIALVPPQKRVSILNSHSFRIYVQYASHVPMRFGHAESLTKRNING